jgi:ferredoxin, 2Fe-2S
MISKFKSGSEVQISFEGGGVFTVERGTSILDAAMENGIELEHFCEGSCSCSTCRVEVLAGGRNLSEMESDELAILGEARAGKGDRLSCQALLRGNVDVKIPEIF